MLQPLGGEILDELAFQAEERHHGRRHAGHIRLQVGHIGIVFLAGQAHRVKHAVCQAVKVQARSVFMHGSDSNFPLQFSLVAVHHIIRNPQHVPQVVVFHIGYGVTDRKLRLVGAALAFAHAGVVNALDIPDDGLLVCFAVKGQKFIPAHPVDMRRLFHVQHQQRGHFADIGVALLMSEKAVDGTEIVDINKNKRKWNRPVFQEFRVIFLHVMFVAGTGAKAAERVHHDFPFQHGGRVFQREEETERDHRNRRAGKQEFLDEDLYQLHRDQKEQHRHQQPFQILADGIPVDQDHHRGRNEEQETQRKADGRRGAGAGVSPAECGVFDFQHAGQQQDHIDGNHRVGRDPYIPVLPGIAEIGNVCQDFRGKQHRGQIENNVGCIVHPGRRRRRVIHSPHSNSVHDDMHHGKSHNKTEETSVLPHAE